MRPGLHREPEGQARTASRAPAFSYNRTRPVSVLLKLPAFATEQPLHVALRLPQSWRKELSARASSVQQVRPEHSQEKSAAKIWWAGSVLPRSECTPTVR